MSKKRENYFRAWFESVPLVGSVYVEFSGTGKTGRKKTRQILKLFGGETILNRVDMRTEDGKWQVNIQRIKK